MGTPRDMTGFRALLRTALVGACKSLPGVEVLHVSNTIIELRVVQPDGVPRRFTITVRENVT